MPPMPPIPAALRLGTLAFLAVFALGFLLGTVRVLVLAPRMGEVAAVLLELPLMLAAAWAIWGRLMRGRPMRRAEAALAGATALSLLLAAEAALSVMAFGRSPAQHLALYAEAPHLIGLAGQAAFAAISFLRLRAT